MRLDEALHDAKSALEFAAERRELAQSLGSLIRAVEADPRLAPNNSHE